MPEGFIFCVVWNVMYVLTLDETVAFGAVSCLDDDDLMSGLQAGDIKLCTL